MTDKEKEGNNMAFLGYNDSKDNYKDSKSTKEINTNTTNIQGLNGGNISAGKGTSRQSSNNNNQSINKDPNINKIIELLNENINSQFNTLISTIRGMLIDDENLNEFHYNVLKEYTIIRSSIMKLRKSGRVREAILKMDELLGVK